MLNFNQLRVFYHAAKNESFTSAAQELFISQPAITAQIKALEENTDLKLFKKKGRNIFLTDQGKTLLEYVKKVFSYEIEIENAISDMKTLNLGILRLGTTKAYARYFMPFLIVNFHKIFPKIRIHLDEGSSDDMINSLLEFKNELAVIAEVREHPDITFIPFSQEEMVLILPPEHPWTKRDSIHFKELVQEPIIMKETGSGTRKIVNTTFKKHGYVPDILVETSNSEFIKQLVQRGEGISFLVKPVVNQELKENKLATVQIVGEKMYLDVSVAYLKKQPISPPAREFLVNMSKLQSAENPTLGIGALMGKILSQLK